MALSSDLKLCSGLVLVMGCVTLPLGCGDDAAVDLGTDTDPDPGPDPDASGGPESEDVAVYLQELPTWEEFSPPLAAQEPLPLPEAEPVETVETVEGVTEINEEGEVEVLGDVSYECTELPYSMASNPGAIVLSDPSRDVIYPGSFIQGRTHRDGISIGDVLPLTVTKRAPIRVSIPDIASPVGENFREVAPNQAEVAAAIGSLVGNASRNDLDTPSSISFEMQTYHSEKQFALSAGVSGRYLGFKASASGSIDQNASTNTVAVQFTQRMFTVVVEPPGSGPESFFADDFTVEDLEALEQAGRIGPDNLPVYVSNAVYGRMMTFTLTSTASESEIRAALQASYNTIAGGVSGSLSSKHKSILSESTIVLTTLGGDAADALSVIRSGDWSAYFTNEASLSTAVPLQYTFKNLGDNSIAAVSETTEYTVKTCEAQQANPGVFEPLDAQSFELEMGTVAEVLVADSDGDGYDDLIFNHRGDDNRIAVLHGSEDGTLSRGVLSEFDGEDGPATWSPYNLRAGDVDGDGDADLVWNYNAGPHPTLTGRLNAFYVGLSGGGTDTDEESIAYQPLQSGRIGSTLPNNHPFHLMDLDGDGMVEPILAFGREYNPGFATRSNLSLGSGHLNIADYYQIYYDLDDPGHGSDSPNYLGDFVGDFNGDGSPDVLWNRLLDPEGSATNQVYLVTRRGPAELVQLSNVFEPHAGTPVLGAAPDGGWNDGYQTLAGDIDIDGADDLVWVKTTDGTAHIKVARGGNSGLTPLPGWSEPFVLEDGPSDLEAHLSDVSGNDGADLILNLRDGAINRVYVGLSLGDGTFDFGAIPQDIFADEAWSQFDLHVGNFGGSAKKDLAWVSATESPRVYIAIAR